MFNAYKKACEGDYDPAVMAPLIPVNGFGYLRILKKTGTLAEYEKRFGKARYSSEPDTPIQSNPEVAKFMWGNDGTLDGIDKLNANFENLYDDIIACPIRFSIGAILFERSLWQDMGYFRVVRGTNSLGADES